MPSLLMVSLVVNVAVLVYKLLTPLTVGSLKHPVVLSNLGIAALHVVTLTTLLAN